MAIGFRSAGTTATRSSGTTPLTVAVPASTAAGDLLIMTAASFIGGSGGVAITTPSGYTLLASVANTPANYWAAIYYKVAGAAEGAATVTAVATCALDAKIYGFTGCDTTTPIDVSGSFGSLVTGTSVTVPSITTATANAWQLAIGMDSNSALDGSSVPSGWTLRGLTLSGNNVMFLVLDTVLVASAGATTATSYPRTFAGSPGLDPITFAIRNLSSTTWNGSSTVSLTDTVTTTGKKTTYGASVVSLTDTVTTGVGHATVHGASTTSETVTVTTVSRAVTVHAATTVSETVTVTTRATLVRMTLTPRPPGSLVLVPVTRPLPALTLPPR